MLEQIDWKKVRGLIPAIIQSKSDQSVLMLGYMNATALQLTRETGVVHFYSRTKKRIWKKGETSGNTLELISMYLDCDSDALLLIVTPKNSVCHKGLNTCFEKKISLEKGSCV